jgi:hypothetical protein
VWHSSTQNEIDETVLPNSTAEDLKDLSVGIVGHRRKILDAIGRWHRPHLAFDAAS